MNLTQDSLLHVFFCNSFKIVLKPAGNFFKKRPRNIWREFFQLCVYKQQNIFEKTLLEVCSSRAKVPKDVCFQWSLGASVKSFVANCKATRFFVATLCR